MKKKIKKIANGCIAIGLGYLPVVIPDEHIILAMVILGQIFTAIIIYSILELINN